MAAGAVAHAPRPEAYGKVLQSLPEQVELDLAGYQAMLDRLLEIAEGKLPPGAVVLVVSRGDEELVDVQGRHGWHFPRHEDGRYAGHYPQNSGGAIAHLEELRVKGADYIVFPATSFWWFQHYPEFAHHLKTRYPTVVQLEDTCVIFALREFPAWGVSGFLETLLPPDATLIVVSSGDPGLIQLGRREAWHFPHTETGAFDHNCSSEEAISRLEDAIERGAEYLVLPSALGSWLDEHPDFRDEVERRYSEVLRRDHPCAVFDLRRPASDG